MTTSTGYQGHVPKDLCVDCVSFILPKPQKPIINCEDILVFLNHFREKRQEYFVVLAFDNRHHLITRKVITIGLVNTAIIHPREVYTYPLTVRAASIIVAHNHPSGEEEPSKEDIRTTQQLAIVGHILGIPLQDHIILTSKKHYSFKMHSKL